MAALILVDVQYDFLPGGALAVSGSDAILDPILDDLLPSSPSSTTASSSSSTSHHPWRSVVATQDYHPPGHISFASSHKGAKVLETKKVAHPIAKGEEIDQVMWPDHCVQGTRGAKIEHRVAERLREVKAAGCETIVVQKGTDAHVDGYSGLSDNAYSRFTPLIRYLSSLRIDIIVVCGLATDYCVLYTAMDLAKFGYTVILPRDATRGVNAEGDSSGAALEKLETAGVKVVETAREARQMAGEMVRRIEEGKEKSYLEKFEEGQARIWEQMQS